MADQNTPIEINTRNPGDVIVKVCDSITTSQQLRVTNTGRLGINLRDASVDGNSLRISTSGRAGINIHDPTNDAYIVGITEDGELKTLSTKELEVLESLRVLIEALMALSEKSPEGRRLLVHHPGRLEVSVVEEKDPLREYKVILRSDMISLEVAKSLSWP